MSGCLDLLDNSKATLNIKTPLSWLYAGPKDLLLYTLVQGVLTVLAIKEVWSIACVAVKGRSADLHVNRVVRWNVVENFEDLRKTFQRILVPCARDLYRTLPSTRGEGRINKSGWKLVICSGLVAFLLFGFDVGIIVLGAPSLSLIHASSVQSITWANNGNIPVLNSTSEVLQGSFSRTIVKESLYNDIEMIRQSSVSLERTDILDFKHFIGDLPDYVSYNKTFFECDGAEGWRIICRVFTQRRLYQYKLRLDVSTDFGDSFFIPVNDFDLTTDAKNSLEDYVKQMSVQLGINATIAFRNATTFRLRAEEQPPELVNLRGKPNTAVLTHDAILTLFLGSIQLCAGPINPVLQWRKKGERSTIQGLVMGNVAKSQRPRLSLLMTLFMYGFTALVSIGLQSRLRVDHVAKDMDVVFELMGKSKDPELGVLNITAKKLEVVHSRTTGFRGEHDDDEVFEIRDDPHDPERVIIEHTGFLPAVLLKDIARFMRHRQNEDIKRLQDEWGVIMKDSKG